MNTDAFQNGWKELREKTEPRWNKPTPRGHSQTEGRRDQILGAIQNRYGIQREGAEKQLAELERKGV